MGVLFKEECMGCSAGDEQLTLMKCHSYMKPLKGGSLSVTKEDVRM